MSTWLVAVTLILSIAGGVLLGSLLTLWLIVMLASPPRKE